MDDQEPAATSEPPRESSWRRVRWRLSDVAIALAPLAVVRAYVAVADPKPLPELVRWAALVLFIGWMLAFPLWMARWRGGPFPRLPRPRRLAIEVLIAVPTLVALWFALGALVIVWERLAGAPVEPGDPFDRMVWSPDATWRVAILLLIVTVSSVAEEVLFRGLVYNALRQRMPPIVAAVVQALAFGFLHSYGVVHSVLASALGFAFAGVYEWRKTLLAPILLHVFQNVVVVLVAAAAAYSAANAPVLGVTGEPAEEGCRITIVYPGSAAEAAALRPGDVITVMDGWGIADIKDVATVVRQKQAGDTVVIEFIRDGERQEARAVLRKRE